MEFNEKLQQLRKAKNMTQEELASALYVSRTAISKWESGRGYPNIESIKQIAKFFSVSIDELLSGEEIITFAEEETKKNSRGVRNTVFGFMDLSAVLFFIVPVFAQKRNGLIEIVSLLSLSEISPMVRNLYFIVTFLLILSGIFILAMQTCTERNLVLFKTVFSLLVNCLAAFMFIISPQPNVAALLFVFFLLKLLLLVKKK